MNIVLRTFVLALVMVFCLAHSVTAGIIVSIAPSTSVPLVAGSGASLDVFIRSSDGFDVLDGFQVEFGLTSAGGPVGGLRFADPQLDSQLSAGNYVFIGRSLSFNTGAPVGAVSGLGSSFLGYDATDDGSAAPNVGNPNPLTLGTSPQLLFRLDLFADFAGDYLLDILSADFFSDQLDPPANPLLIDTLPASYSLSVTGSAAVPEPGTFAMLAIAGAGFIGRKWRRRAKSGLQVAESHSEG